MRALPKNTKLVVATHNEGKLGEFQKLLAPYFADITSAGALGLSEPVEDGDSFEANAKIKALAAAKESGFVALADDSGLCVDALNGDPGLFSARWVQECGGVKPAMARLHKRLGDNPNRRAHFFCCLVLAWPDGHTEIFKGRMDGTMVWPTRGTNGHGYDPMMQPDGYDQTLGELSADIKNTISHRGLALEKMMSDLKNANL